MKAARIAVHPCECVRAGPGGRSVMDRWEPVLWALAVAVAMLVASCTGPQPVLASAGETAKQEGDTVEGETVVFDFGGPEAHVGWQTINDAVMGGVSRSSAGRGDGGAFVFAGTVSLENQGGFASVSSPVVDVDLAGSHGVAVRVRGDGKTYKLSAATDRAFGGIMYQAPFATLAGKWTEVRIPFGDFTPTYHGRVLTDRPPLDGEAVRSFGFLLSDRQEGPFRLEVEWIKCYPGQSS